MLVETWRYVDKQRVTTKYYASKCFREQKPIDSLVCNYSDPIGLCTRNLCPGRGGAAGGTRKRENAKTPSTETGKSENAKTAKTRKRRKHNPFRSTLNTNVITDLGMCRYVRQQSIPYTSNTNFITALGMCKVCTEAAQSAALWTWTLSQLWACVKYVPKQSCSTLNMNVISQLWACVKYVPKQSIA